MDQRHQTQQNTKTENTNIQEKLLELFGISVIRFIDLKQIEFSGTHSRIELHSLLNWSLI